MRSEESHCLTLKQLKSDECTAKVDPCQQALVKGKVQIDELRIQHQNYIRDKKFGLVCLCYSN